MDMTFRDREQAGEILAEKLSAYARRADAVILALPRGGVPVAYRVASRLQLPLDVFVVRKLGVPGHEELAMGAVASGGVRVINEGVVSQLRISEEVLESAARRELQELERRERAYRNGRPPLSVEGKTILLVDDGIATGSTMLAAIKALRAGKAGKIVVAVPTIAASSLSDFEEIADEVVAVIAPETFLAVGQWYEDFSQTSDEEVQDLLEKGRDLRAA
jgi:putative phosphoribosyl transferase